MVADIAQCKEGVELSTDPIKYPCEVRCYLLTARDGNPPLPEDEPVARRIVGSRAELDLTKKDMVRDHPGGWCVELPVS